MSFLWYYCTALFRDHLSIKQCLSPTQLAVQYVENTLPNIHQREGELKNTEVTSHQWCFLSSFLHDDQRLCYVAVSVADAAVCLGGRKCTAAATVQSRYFIVVHGRCSVLVFYECRWLFYWICDTSHGHSPLITTLSFTGKQAGTLHTLAHAHTHKDTYVWENFSTLDWHSIK